MVSHHIRSRPKGGQGHDALFTSSPYRGITHFTEDEQGRIADAKKWGLFDAFALAVREVMPDRVPKDMERFYIGFFRKAVPYTPSAIPQSFRDVCGNGVQFWIAESIAAVIDTDGYLRTFVPAGAIAPPQRKETPGKHFSRGGDDGHIRGSAQEFTRARYGAYVESPGALSTYLNAMPNKASFGRGTLY